MGVALPRWGIVCLCFPAAFLNAAPDNVSWLGRPFVQRVAVTDFLLLETNNDLALSPSHQLVVGFANGEAPAALQRIVALRQKSRDTYLVTYLTALPHQSGPRFQTREFELDAPVARNVLACFRHLLQQNTLPAPAELHQASSDDDAWIFVRTEDHKALAAVTLNRALHANSGEDSAIYRDLCAGLFGMFVVAEDRSAIVKQLDRLTAIYVKTHHLDGH